MPVTIEAGLLDLAAIIRPGELIAWGHGTSEPLTLTRALVRQRHRLGGVRLFFGAQFSDTLTADQSDGLTLTSFGAVGTSGALSRAGVLEVIPCHISELPGLMSSGVIPVDVALVQVSPPDSTGRHSLGLAADYVRAAMRRARVVLAEVNDQVPWTCGDTAVDPGQLDYVVPTSCALLELPGRPADEVTEAIGRHVADLVPNGSVLQVGIGAVPDAILASLAGKRDLGVHSGFIGDSIAELMQAGVVTNRRKPVDPGVTITGALFGTRRLYDFADRNPDIQLRSISYLHDPAVHASLGSLVSINSAIEVDLTGQVNAETVSGHHVGAVGGQVDFVRAAARSPGGRSIIALPATARGGSVSRIVARLADGVVTTARSDVDVIATEYGLAELSGRSLSERARRLIAIAHPAFRDQLEQHAGDLY